MCTFKIEPFKKDLKSILQEKDLHKAFKITAEFLTSCCPNTKIWFAEKLGKRWSYIIGSGEELFTETEIIPIIDNYAIFVENYNSLNNEEKQLIDTIIKSIKI